jgi:hypothetical protein
VSASDNSRKDDGDVTSHIRNTRLRSFAATKRVECRNKVNDNAMTMARSTTEMVTTSPTARHSEAPYLILLGKARKTMAGMMASLIRQRRCLHNTKILMDQGESLLMMAARWGTDDESQSHLLRGETAAISTSNEDTVDSDSDKSLPNLVHGEIEPVSILAFKFDITQMSTNVDTQNASVRQLDSLVVLTS